MKIPTIRVTIFAILFLVTTEAVCLPASLTADTVWSGTVHVEGQLVVEKGATLTINPGTKVLFKKAAPDEEGLAASGIIVKGTVVAAGLPGARITFTSGEVKPASGDWGEVKVSESAGSSFADCDFSYGGWGLHVHESDLKVLGCTFRDNSSGGIRGKAGNVEVTGCDIEGMDIGIRYWKGALYVHHNTISRNKTGIFLRQECGAAKIDHNNIYGNDDYDLKLGDGQKEDVDARYNWWGGVLITDIRGKIYDKSRETYIGRAMINPVLKEAVSINEVR